MTNNGQATVINDRYEIHKRIGQRRHGGGRGVLRARSAARPPGRSEGVVRRVRNRRELHQSGSRREAQSAASLSAAQDIVNVYDWGEYEGTYFIVMEEVQGRTLAEVLSTNKQLTSKQAAESTRARSPPRWDSPTTITSPIATSSQPTSSSAGTASEAGRLRDRPGAQRTDRVEPHPGRLGHGHCDVLLPRAGAGCAARPAQRPVLARHRNVRDGGRQAAVHRREPGEHRLRAGA